MMIITQPFTKTDSYLHILFNTKEFLFSDEAPKLHTLPLLNRITEYFDVSESERIMFFAIIYSVSKSSKDSRGKMDAKRAKTVYLFCCLLQI